MKENIKFAIVTSLILVGFFFPVSETVTIEKNSINENRPFAGVINDVVVGTELCCKYWLAKNKQPDVVTYHITRPAVLQYLGYIYSYEEVAH